MPYREFTFDTALEKLQLDLREEELFANTPSVAISDDLRRRLLFRLKLASAVDTEKARSEFVVSTVLLELKEEMPDRFSLFSGVEFNVDPAHNLNGVCDFLLSRSPIQQTVRAPIFAIAEAKNDNISAGLGQCVATMAAARLFNEQHKTDISAVYGAVTNGNLWKFLRLVGSTLTVDLTEYSLSDPGRIMGILRHIILAG